MTTKKSKKQTSDSTTEKRPGKRKKIVSLAEYEAEAKAQKHDGGKGEPAAPTVAHVSPGSKKSPKAGKPAKERKLSGLDAAAQILTKAGRPLSTKEMVERMLAKGLWRTTGKTPAATIYAALLRHIQKNGADSRFRKVDRGRFELVK